MKRSATVKVFMLLIQLTAILMFMPAGAATAADAITLQASEPAIIYYTTNGAVPAAPISNISAASAPVLTETISLVPNAGKGTHYVKQQKLKIHESKHEFEKHVKQKHGKRFRVETFRVTQTEYGLEGFIDIIENRDTSILPLGETCNEDEWGRRVGIAREFIINNPELIGVTENEELRVLINKRRNCGNIYFDRYVNGYEMLGSRVQLIFRPQYNYSIYAVLDRITPEMYEAAQQKALTEEEVTAIVYKDLNISMSGNNYKPGKLEQNLPNLRFRKLLMQREPYVIWEVSGKNVYEINAITGEILTKVRNIRN